MGILLQMFENIESRSNIRININCMLNFWWLMKILNSCEANCYHWCARPETDHRPRNHGNHSMWGYGNTTAHHYLEQEPRRPHWQTQSKVSSNGTTIAKNMIIVLYFFVCLTHFLTKFCIGDWRNTENRGSSSGGSWNLSLSGREFSRPGSGLGYRRSFA